MRTIVRHDGNRTLTCSNRAYVVANKKQISADEIAQWVAGQVASYKKLRGGVIFIDAIPKSPSGKLLRKELRALVKRETSAKL